MATFVDTLVADIRKVSGDQEMKELAAKLNAQEEQLSKLEVSMLDTMIECLDINFHSLGIMAALLGKVQQEDKIVDWALFVKQMKQFSANFDVIQTRQYLPLTLCTLYHQFTDVVCRKRRGHALEAIPILQSAVLRFRKSPSHLTAIHGDLIQLCLLAKNVKPCLPFLKQDFNCLQDEDHQLDFKYVLLYYYYGGMVFTCLHDYHQAMLFFTICVTTPSMAISAIMVAAFKKYILVSLLKYGKEMSLPRYSVHIVERALKPLCGPYIQLSRAFVGGKIDTVQSVVTKYQDNFNSDGNAGLVRRLVARVKKHTVKTLTHTFMTVSMADVSSRLNLSSEQEAEKYIRDMIEDGEVHASLDQAEGMVSFVENPEQFDSVAIVQHMEGQLQHCVELQRKLATFDKELTLDPRYVHKQMKSGIDDDPMFQDEPV